MDMTDLKDRLETWEQAGLMSPEQASRILEFEAASPTRRFPPWMEAVAYLGAALVLVALGLLISDLWDRLTGMGQFLIALLATGILVGAGWMLRRSDEPAALRAGSFSWLLGIVAAGFAGWVLGNRLLDISEEGAGLLAAVVALAAAIPMWTIARSTVQMIGMAGASAFAAVSLMVQFDPIPEWGFNIAFATLGVVWLLLTWAGIFEPPRVSYALGAFSLLLIGFFEVTGTMPWPAIGLVTALAVMAIAVRLDQGIMLGIGVAGLFLYLSTTVFEVFENQLAVVIALLITGVAVLAWILVRARRSPGTE